MLRPAPAEHVRSRVVILNVVVRTKAHEISGGDDAASSGAQQPTSRSRPRRASRFPRRRLRSSGLSGATSMYAQPPNSSRMTPRWPAMLELHTAEHASISSALLCGDHERSGRADV